MCVAVDDRAFCQLQAKTTWMDATAKHLSRNDDRAERVDHASYENQLDGGSDRTAKQWSRKESTPDAQASPVPLFIGSENAASPSMANRI